ncbi:MAG: hypothetical protein FJ343_04345 [Sphingomonadales bacterium]|nr:hypothetical protein [Sphingomonadales bacterium]
MSVLRFLIFATITVSLTMSSCLDRGEEAPWNAPEHPADRLEPWRAAGDTLSWIALRWIQSLDRGDTLGLRAVLADTLRIGEDTPVAGASIFQPLFYRYRSGYRQETECLALLPAVSLADSVTRVMGYLRQRYQDGQVGASSSWKYRRLAVLWEIRSLKIVFWSVWEQDWPSTPDSDSLRLTPWPRWGMRCTNAPDSLRFKMLAWEKRLKAIYVRDAELFWNDTSSVRSDDGWIWSGPPVTMARFMASQAAPYRDLDSVRRELDRVEVLRLGEQGEFLGLAFGSEQCYRNSTVVHRGVHRLYFWRNGKIAFAEQYRASSFMP